MKAVVVVVGAAVVVVVVEAAAVVVVVPLAGRAVPLMLQVKKVVKNSPL